ncbi:hypothetical protein EST35_0415 [Pseudomonas phage vB_PaeM_PA5oct]|uniref:Uncharacterized protein n=1 Tax=Pseudomonas phage vB_PaeM_PA5oct TaxID=2163605 RepID=A0A4Y5JYW3_9CAUD|nr:hypothetical protein PQE65_gp082 [Pseudomonas phage vB_PaeM_PA5oct]QCG76283.1 hypothetical protein EST35_0415 [Pseudomonas phage vB_PaeM_PA5oct]
MNKHFDIIAELEYPTYTVQVRKYRDDGRYEVGQQPNEGEYIARHENCTADDAIRVLSHYCTAALYKIKKQY